MIRLTLPYPPSANRYWRTFRGHTVVSAEAKAYKRQVALMLKTAGHMPETGPVAYVAHVYRPQKSGDLGNRLKVLEDALNGIAWVDDKQVVELHAYRHEDKANPRVEVEVRPLGVEGVLPPLPPACMCGHRKVYHDGPGGACAVLECACPAWKKR